MFSGVEESIQASPSFSFTRSIHIHLKRYLFGYWRIDNSFSVHSCSNIIISSSHEEDMWDIVCLTYSILFYLILCCFHIHSCYWYCVCFQDCDNTQCVPAGGHTYFFSQRRKKVCAYPYVFHTVLTQSNAWLGILLEFYCTEVYSITLYRSDR